MSRSRRVMVRATEAEKARALLVEDEEAAWPEIANAKHLEDTGGRGPRGYGLAGSASNNFDDPDADHDGSPARATRAPARAPRAALGP